VRVVNIELNSVEVVVDVVTDIIEILEVKESFEVGAIVSHVEPGEVPRLV
jgi:hypothetical protein